MDSNNQHIKKYLDYYKNLEDPGFAVLLKGEWGSGKTYFIKEYFNLNDGEFKSEVNALYISLYGITNIGSINSLIFQKLHPLWTSRQAKVFGQVAKGLLKASLKIDLNSDQKEDGSISLQIPDLRILEEFININNKILIFDDLERCNIPINDLLGYINYFVEHQSLKVIIIADEDKIDGDIISKSQAQNYDKIKEKIIGKSWTIDSSFDYAYRSFVSKYVKDNNSFLKDFLNNEEQLNFIKTIFNSGTSYNLRILKNIILDFCQISYFFPKEAYEKPDFLTHVLQNLALLSLEIKLGRLVDKDIPNLYKAEMEWNKIELKKQSQSFSTAKKEANSDKVQAEKNRKFPHLDPFFDNLKNHYCFSINDFLPNYLWWSDFFTKGKINLEDLGIAFKSSKYNISEDTDLWQKLYYFEDLSDYDFNQLIQQSLDKIDNKYKFEDLGVFLQIAFLLIFFADQELIPEESEFVLTKLKNYIDFFGEKSSDLLSSENLNDLEVDVDDEGFYYLIGYKQKVFKINTKNTTNFCDFKNYFLKEMNNHRCLRTIEKIKNLFKKENLLDEEISQICYFISSIDKLDHILGRVIFLRKDILDIEWFAKNIMKLSYYQQEDILKSINHRYPELSEDENGEACSIPDNFYYAKQINKLPEELSFIESLYQFFKDSSERLKKEGNLLSYYKLNFLIEKYLHKCIQKIKDSKRMAFL